MPAHTITRCRLPDGRSVHLITDRADMMVGQAIRRSGGWEPAETALVQALVTPGETVADIGAHIGYYTVLLSGLTGPAGQVIAFEPEPRNFELLKANCILNGCGNVVLEARAVGDRSGKASLYLATDNLGDHRLHPGTGRPSCQVTVVRFDEYWRAGRLHFIKLDAQGSEPAILNGAVQTIKANAPHLLCLMELSPGLCHAGGFALHDVVAILTRLDARVFLATSRIVAEQELITGSAFGRLWQELLAAERDDANASLLLAFSAAGYERLQGRLGAAAAGGGQWTFGPMPATVPVRSPREMRVLSLR